MNLSEKLAAADDGPTSEPAPEEAAGRLATGGPGIREAVRAYVRTPSASRGRRVIRCGGRWTGRARRAVEAEQGQGPGQGARRDRADCRRSVTRRVAEQGPCHGQRDPRARGHRDLADRTPALRRGDARRLARLRAARSAARDNTITEIMCNAYDEIWIERKGKIDRSDIIFTNPQPVPPDHRPHGARRRPPGRRVIAHGRCPLGRRIPYQRHRAPAGAPRPRPDHSKVPRAGLPHAGPDQPRHY